MPQVEWEASAWSAGPAMRDRWRTVSRLWEENKASANKLNLLKQLDYYGKLSAQLDWQQNPGE